MERKNALLLMDDRIAPRFDKTEKILLFPADGGNDPETCEKASVKHMKPREICDFLVNSEIGTLVCGGVKESCMRSLAGNGIRIIDNVIGSAAKVMALLNRGELESGRVVD